MYLRFRIPVPFSLCAGLLLTGCAGLAPSQPWSARPDEQEARAHLQRRCTEDGGLHVHESYALPRHEPLTFQRASRWTTQYPGVREPLGVFNGRFEVWQAVSWESVPPLRMRRTETSLTEPASGKLLVVAVNYRLVRGAPSSFDPQCGDTSLQGLAEAALRP